MQLGILLNSMKRMVDVLRPDIEAQFRAWSSCIPDGENAALCDRLSEVTVLLRARFRSYLEAVVEKLVENVSSMFFFFCNLVESHLVKCLCCNRLFFFFLQSKLQKETTLKKILQECKKSVGEEDMGIKMQTLKEQLTNTVNHLHSVCGGTDVFIALSRGYWDRMGEVTSFNSVSWVFFCVCVLGRADLFFSCPYWQIVLSFLEKRKKNRYTGSRVAVTVRPAPILLIALTKRLLPHLYVNWCIFADVRRCICSRDAKATRRFVERAGPAASEIDYGDSLHSLQGHYKLMKASLSTTKYQTAKKLLKIP